MACIEITTSRGEKRSIETMDDNFLIVYNGATGPIHDAENFGHLKIDDKHIISLRYADIVRNLYLKFDRYLYTLWPEKICFLIDGDWAPKENGDKAAAWKIDIAKANALFCGVTGYEYIVKMRMHWIEQWSQAQLHAAIMSQLLRINNEKGKIIKYTEDIQSRLVATFGAGYLEPGTVIKDLLDDGTPDVLRGFPEASGQITIEEMMLEDDKCANK